MKELTNIWSKAYVQRHPREFVSCAGYASTAGGSESAIAMI